MEEKKKLKVYIAGPYSKGDVAINVKRAMDFANEIILMGHHPFCPHLSHFLHINNSQPYEKWLELDIAYLKVCDILYRIEGESPGADKEVEIATSLNIPVIYSLNNLLLFE